MDVVTAYIARVVSTHLKSIIYASVHNSTNYFKWCPLCVSTVVWQANHYIGNQTVIFLLDATLVQLIQAGKRLVRCKAWDRAIGCRFRPNTLKPVWYPAKVWYSTMRCSWWSHCGRLLSKSSWQVVEGTVVGVKKDLNPHWQINESNRQTLQLNSSLMLKCVQKLIRNCRNKSAKNGQNCCFLSLKLNYRCA